ncbi:alpha/beta hydrolase [Hyalangium sp.]|uniref:alpha/beta hydrolase n=1 Tax=Hyalangium sp. TaxID=2028555 RepID=UPI002D421A52|nr:alpha/beta hydrolase [Hyalangium sp.]HYH98165.1 alpha/beta hydrolase [Hyalangium sp.]
MKSAIPSSTSGAAPEEAAVQPDVDPQTREMLKRVAADPFLDPVNMSPAQMRKAFDAFYAKVDIAPVEVAVTNTAFKGPAGDVPVRIYHPGPQGAAALPVVLFYKGGGLVMGSLDSYDAICRRLARASGAIVVSVAYRQPPEHRSPAATDDCYAALVWAREHAGSFGGDPKRLAVAGDSGGGMLAAVVTHMARDQGGPPIAFQLLIYPAVGTRGGSRSMSLFARGYWFEPEALDWLYSLYAANAADVQSPRVSPILREDLSGLPPAYVVSANFDIIRDDVEHYARLLREAGVPVELRRYETTIHGFFNMGGVIDFVGPAIDECGAKLAAAVTRPG